MKMCAKMMHMVHKTQWRTKWRTKLKYHRSWPYKPVLKLLECSWGGSKNMKMYAKVVTWRTQVEVAYKYISEKKKICLSYCPQFLHTNEIYFLWRGLFSSSNVITSLWGNWGRYARWGKWGNGSSPDWSQKFSEWAENCCVWQN